MTTLALLPATTFGTPSGNYNGSSTSFVGNAVPAANYYGGQGSIQTLAFTVGNLTATLTTQATLYDDPTLDFWFDVYTLTANATSNTVTNSPIGNFSWLRVAVTNFTAGNITVATATY
jgi:hypothetical protein